VVGGPDSDGLPAVVDIVEELGSEEYLFATATIGDQEQRVVTRSMTRSRGLRGEAIRISFRPDSLHLFDVDTGLRLVNASLTTPASELPPPAREPRTRSDPLAGC